MDHWFIAEGRPITGNLGNGVNDDGSNYAGGHEIREVNAIISEKTCDYYY